MSRLFFIPQAVRIDSTGSPYANAKANFYLTGTTTRADTYKNAGISVEHDNPVVADAAGQFAAIYLDPAVTYRCIITESDDTQIDDIDPIWTPLDGGDILITDAGGYYAGTEVETILQDIGANYAKKSSANTFTADITMAADIKMADNVLERPEIKDFSLTSNSISSSSGVLTIDLSTGNDFYTTLTENITSIVISNPSPTGKKCSFTLEITQDGAGGAYTVAQPASVIAPGGTAPVISTGNDAVDDLTYRTMDAGTTWKLDFSQAYA